MQILRWLRLLVMKYVFAAGGVLGIVAGFAALAQDLPAPVTLPAGPGRELVQEKCSLCHELQQVVAPRKTVDEWAVTLDRMIANGAKVSDAEYDPVLNYLAAHFGPASPPPGQPATP